MQQTFYSNVDRRTVGNFVTRQEVQQELTRWLLNDSSPRPVVLCGIGGSGKSQLAIQCCREAEESGYLATLWVDSSTPASVEQSYNAIAKALHKDFADEDDIQTTISLVQDTLRSWPQRWLMVFDNYDNPKVFRKRSIREYIPESKNGFILFTSRHTGLELLGGDRISVSSMTKSESLDLLLRRPPSNSAEETDGLAIADLLGHLALALDQAGAYIRARKLPLEDFISHYEKRKDVIFREVPDDWEYHDQSGPLSVSTTWEMSFGLISGDSETIARKNNFLTLAGFFDPNRISERYFQAYCDAEKVEWMDLFRVDGRWDSYELGDVLAELHKLSLIHLPDQESGERSFTIHPIVCDWLVHRRGKTKQQQMIMELIHALAAFLKCSEEEELPLDVNQETTLHLDRCISHAKAAFGKSDKEGLALLPEVTSLFARFYRRQGRYADAELLLKLALAETERVLGVQHPDSLRALESLAIVSRRQGNYNIAEHLFKRALARRQENLTSGTIDTVASKHLSSGQSRSQGRVDTLRTIQKLANVYSDQGRYDEAEDLFKQSFRGMEENLGSNHLETVSIGQNLANVYQKRGRYDDAELLYQRALEVKETELGSEHPDTLGTVENLANVYRKQQRYMEAEKMFSRSVMSKEKKLGPDHPDTLRAVQNLANVYSDQEQYNQAEGLYRRALEGNEKLLGMEHPDTLRTVENLANLYSKSLSFSSRYLDLSLSPVTPSPSTLKSNDVNKPSYDLAQQLLERALEGNKRKRGLDHPDTLGTMENLAIIYYRNRHYEKAETLLKQALAGKEKRGQTRTTDTLRTLRNLGNVHYKLGRYDEAELEYKRVLDGKESLEQHDIRGTIQSLGRIYRKQGRPEEADRLALSLEAATPEAHPEKKEEQNTASVRDVASEPKKSDPSNDLTVPLPRGRLSISVHQGRGLRPSAEPRIICQFQGATLISPGPMLDGDIEEIEGDSRRGKKPEARNAREDIDLAKPIPTPLSLKKRQRSEENSYQREPKEIRWIVNPKWNWTVTLYVTPNNMMLVQDFRLTLAHSDVFGNDTDIDMQVYDRSDLDATFLGSVSFRPELIEPLLHDEKWHSLRSHVGGESPNITGKVLLSIDFQKTEKNNYGPEDFQITKLIGKGTYGQVYQMQKKDTHQLYAVKVWSKTAMGRVLKGSPKTGDSWYSRPLVFRMPFIADTKFSFETETDLYIATNYMSGGELFWHLQKEGRFDEDRSRFYIAEIVLALQHLHNHDIIYQDLKPENIMLDATGHIMLCHFGLSKGYMSPTKGRDMSTGTTEDVFCGTTEYLAPEAILDPSSCTNMVNFWSLGVLVFEMCCGWSPFYAEDTQQMYQNIAFGKVRFPRNTLTVEGRNFVKGLLNRNPSHRLGSTSGTEELKRHPWFVATDWNAVAQKRITPPFMPRILPVTDISEKVFAFEGSSDLASRTAALAAGVSLSTPLSPSMQANFKGFTFVDEATMDEHVYQRPNEFDGNELRNGRMDGVMRTDDDERYNLHLFDGT